MGNAPFGTAPAIAALSGDTVTGSPDFDGLGGASTAYPLRVRTMTPGRLTATFNRCNDPGRFGGCWYPSR